MTTPIVHDLSNNCNCQDAYVFCMTRRILSEPMTNFRGVSVKEDKTAHISTLPREVQRFQKQKTHRSAAKQEHGVFKFYAVLSHTHWFVADPSASPRSFPLSSKMYAFDLLAPLVVWQAHCVSMFVYIKNATSHICCIGGPQESRKYTNTSPVNSAVIFRHLEI